MILQSAAMGAKKLLVDDKITACVKEICLLSVEADAKLYELALQTEVCYERAPHIIMNLFIDRCPLWP